MVNKQVEQFLGVLKERDINHVFFVACGGSSALMYPSKYLMDREAITITSDLYSSNEFIHRNPKTLGEKSLVILCSLSGTTPETVEAATFARNKGALTVGLTNVEASPLAQASEHYAKFNWGPGTQAIDTNFSIMYQLVTGLLYLKEENQKFHTMTNSLSNLQGVYDNAKDQFLGRAKEFAESYKDEKVIYTMASGANYGPAYAYSICILMEMQWIHSHAIHAGEYFHGPFEIIDKETPFILMLGLDETRPLEERALKFSKQYGERLVVLDAKEFDLTRIAEEVQGYIAPLVFNHVLRVYAEELAIARNHPLSQRRYMWKVEY